MKKLVRPLTASLLLLASPAFSITYNIGESSGIFTPDFRDLANGDAGHTTYFGWGSGGFDGATNNEIIDNPAVTLGAGALDGSLIQVGTVDILSGSNNIYSSTQPAVTLNLTIPTAGTTGSGFTTIIAQGRTAFGGVGDPPIQFGTISGIAPTVIIGNNLAAQGQYWVQWQIPGNLANYSTTVDFPAASFNSLATLAVDTHWSSSGYADIGAIPEPASASLLIASACLIASRRRRTK